MVKCDLNNYYIYIFKMGGGPPQSPLIIATESLNSFTTKSLNDLYPNFPMIVLIKLMC